MNWKTIDIPENATDGGYSIRYREENDKLYVHSGIDDPWGYPMSDLIFIAKMAEGMGYHRFGFDEGDGNIVFYKQLPQSGQSS